MLGAYSSQRLRTCQHFKNIIKPLLSAVLSKVTELQYVAGFLYERCCTFPSALWHNGLNQHYLYVPWISQQTATCFVHSFITQSCLVYFTLTTLLTVTFYPVLSALRLDLVYLPNKCPFLLSNVGRLPILLSAGFVASRVLIKPLFMFPLNCLMALAVGVMFALCQFNSAMSNRDNSTAMTRSKEETEYLSCTDTEFYSTVRKCTGDVKCTPLFYVQGICRPENQNRA